MSLCLELFFSKFISNEMLLFFSVVFFNLASLLNLCYIKVESLGLLFCIRSYHS